MDLLIPLSMGVDKLKESTCVLKMAVEMIAEITIILFILVVLLYTYV